MKNPATRSLVLFALSTMVLSAVTFTASHAMWHNADLKPVGNQTVVKLIVPRFTTTFQTRAGELIASSFAILIQTGLQGEKFKWLDITSDTSLTGPGKKFLLAGSILDLTGGLKLDLHLIAIGDDRTKSEVKSTTYQIGLDSILVQVDGICKDLASTIREQISGRKELSIVVYPFESTSLDTMLSGVGQRIAKSIALRVRELGIGINAFVGDPRTSVGSLAEGQTLVVRGKFSLAKGLVEIVSTITEGKSQKVLYAPMVSMDPFGVTHASRKFANDLRALLLVYHKVGDLLSTLGSAEEFINHANQYSNNSADPDSKLVAEVLCARALQLDSRYVPALLKLAEIQHTDSRYDESIATFEKVLGVDSTQVQAYLGLGEDYFDTSRDSLAVENFEIAVTKGKAQGDTSELSLAYRRLGELNSARKAYGPAIQYFRQALELEKTDRQIWYGLASAHYLRFAESKSQGEDTTDIDLALNYFRQADRIFPNDSTFARNAAYVLNYWGKVYYNEYQQIHKLEFARSAEQKFREASSIRHYDKNLSAENLNYLAWFADQEREEEQAKLLSRQAVQFSPTDEWTYRLFAYLHREDTAHVDEAMSNARIALSISENSSAYEVLPDIYVTRGQLDSALTALSSVKEKKGTLSKETVQRLFLSARYAGKLRLVEPALRDYLAQSVKGRDSVWVHARLAEVYRGNGKLEESMGEVKRAITINPSTLEVLPVLDSLFYRDSVAQSLELKIALLEKYLETQRQPRYLRELAWAYASKNAYTKSDEILGQAKKASKTRADTANALYLEGRISYDRAREAYTRADSIRARLLMNQALLNFERVWGMYPSSEGSLFYLELIYHEYIIDYEKAYGAARRLLAINDSNKTYAMNAVEAMLTAQRFNELDSLSKKILREDSLAKAPLNLESKLAIRFILMASRVLRGDILGAHSHYGVFRDDYETRPDRKEEIWIWTGSKHFLESYPDYKNPSHRDLLLSIIKALELQKAEGRTLLQNADVAWGKFLTAQNVKPE